MQILTPPSVALDSTRSLRAGPSFVTLCPRCLTTGRGVEWMEDQKRTQRDPRPFLLTGTPGRFPPDSCLDATRTPRPVVPVHTVSKPLPDTDRVRAFHGQSSLASQTDVTSQRDAMHPPEVLSCVVRRETRPDVSRRTSAALPAGSVNTLTGRAPAYLLLLPLHETGTSGFFVLPEVLQFLSS